VALKLAHKAEEGFKGALTEVGLEHTRNGPGTDGRGGYGSSLIFEEMGMRYLGPMTGTTCRCSSAPSSSPRRAIIQ
jgi:hypothetical protein